MKIHSERLLKYKEAAVEWARAWPRVLVMMKELSLTDSHQVMLAEAERHLPKSVTL